MTSTIYSILPPLIAMVMVIATRRVLLSLGVGIVSAAILIGEFKVGETLLIIWSAVKGVFISDGALNTWNVYIILFLFILGIITAFISISGGSRAFGEWAMKRVKTRVGAQLVGVFLGIIIFIDDYFNALAVGQVSRPITDRQRVSRAKLAYLIDSTSAPMCVISPISSWGAYIIAIIASIIAANNLTEFSPFSSFIKMIPMNFYVWASFALIFITVLRGVNFGAMEKHEQLAISQGVLFDPNKTIPGELKEELPVSSRGSVGDLVWPIMALVIGTVGSMLWTGAHAVGEGATIFTIFENTDVSASLLYGGLFGLLVTLILFFNHVLRKKSVPKSVFKVGVIEGIKSMLPAIYILVFAWIIVDLIGQLETGLYLAGLVEKFQLNTDYIPAILFIIAGIMAFSTGTSWGSFGILLPIAADIAVATDISLLLPGMSAVLAGAVFGDHCSPISDTTILSSTGAGCNHMDHVMTQLPYALTSALVAFVSYLILGLSGSIILSLISLLVLILGFVFLLEVKRKRVLQ